MDICLRLLRSGLREPSLHVTPRSRSPGRSIRASKKSTSQLPASGAERAENAHLDVPDEDLLSILSLLRQQAAMVSGKVVL